MKLINERNLKNICSSQETRKTLATAGITCIACSLLTLGSVLLIKDIQKINNELKNYPEIDDTMTNCDDVLIAIVHKTKASKKRRYSL